MSLVAAGLSTAWVHAEDAVAEPARLAGSYVYSGGEKGEEALRQAIATVVGQMNFLIRGIASGRLQNTNQPYRTVQFVVTPDGLEFTRDGGNPVKTDLKGTPADWTREDKKVYKVSQQWQDGVLVQRFEASDGSRTNRYRLAADGAALTMDVTVESPKLPTPLRYSLEFRRKVR